MQHGVTVAQDGSALVGHNEFVVDPSTDSSGPALETIGISAPGPKALTEVANNFSGLKVQTAVAGATPSTRPAGASH
jgi:hypothetical protein